MEEIIKDVAGILVKSKYAVALTGAGVSTESGIPDFRGPSGIWTKNPEAEKMQYEIYGKFLYDPKSYWIDVINEGRIFGNLEKALPNPSHYALVEMERMNILKCIITQNIDNLHQKAGSKNVIDIHGNAFKLRCINCGKVYQRNEFDITKIINEGKIPTCRKCSFPLKLDVVYFNEPIPREVYKQSLQQVLECDVMIVAGTSAEVYPAAEFPRIAKNKSNPAIIIEINAEPTSLTEEGVSDYFIQGKTGKILPEIVDEIKKVIQ